MSQVQDYEYGTDGKWYKSAILGKEGEKWFICFDDDDDPELVIATSMDITDPSLFLKERGLNFTVLRQSHGDGVSRCFVGIKNMEEASAWFLQLTGPIQVEWIIKHSGIRTLRPQGPCTLWGYSP